MNFEEFLKPDVTETVSAEEKPQAEEEHILEEENIDVQKAVVESLAADKAEQEEVILNLRKENDVLKKKIQTLGEKIDEQNKALLKVGEVLAKNSETPESTKITLLERNIELPDRFPGETRDHVLEVIKEAKDKAEEDGRIRRAQLLESVLLANESSGKLAEKRANFLKFFNENQNILSGAVIQELEKNGISYKKGEEYLLPSEILKRTY